LHTLTLASSSSSHQNPRQAAVPAQPTWAVLMLAHIRCSHRTRPRSRRAHTGSVRHEARAARARCGHARTLKYGFDKALEASPYRLAPRGNQRVETREPPIHKAMLTLLTRGGSCLPARGCARSVSPSPARDGLYFGDLCGTFAGHFAGHFAARRDRLERLRRAFGADIAGTFRAAAAAALRCLRWQRQRALGPILGLFMRFLLETAFTESTPTWRGESKRAGSLNLAESP
jgi:hypothetical protein